MKKTVLMATVLFGSLIFGSHDALAQGYNQQYDTDYMQCYQLADQRASGNTSQWQKIHNKCMADLGYEGDNSDLMKI